MRIEAQDNVYAVKASRLAWGEWRGEKKIGEGDIRRSYSADRIADGKPIRSPFEWQGSYWSCVSIAGAGLTITRQHEFRAYRLVPRRLFSGEPTSYRDKTAIDDRLTAAREDPLGFYHGITVRHGKNTFVLAGPPAKFVANKADGEQTGAQLRLFE